MPIYEFSCTQCEHNFEILTKSCGYTEVECPKCHSTKVVKQISAPSLTMGNTSSSEKGCTPRSGFS